MAKKRFPNWHPTVGERALVPGGPANANYVAELSADDVAAIERGHRGYLPLKFHVFAGSDHHKGMPVWNKHDSLDLFWYNERTKRWVCGRDTFKSIASITRAVNQFHKTIDFYIDVNPNKES